LGASSIAARSLLGLLVIEKIVWLIAFAPDPRN
jgi:hypothetical protein